MNFFWDLKKVGLPDSNSGQLELSVACDPPVPRAHTKKLKIKVMMKKHRIMMSERTPLGKKKKKHAESESKIARDEMEYSFYR